MRKETPSGWLIEGVGFPPDLVLDLHIVGGDATMILYVVVSASGTFQRMGWYPTSPGEYVASVYRPSDGHGKPPVAWATASVTITKV